MIPKVKNSGLTDSLDAEIDSWLRDKDELSQNSLKNYYHTLKSLYRFTKKSVYKMTKDDVQSWLEKERKEGKAEGSINHYKITVKKYFREHNRPEIVDWIKYRFNVGTKHLPEIISSDEIKNLINAASTSAFNVRDSAVLAALFESGMRAKEFLALHIKDFGEDQYGCYLTIPEKEGANKTGQRKVAIFDSVPYIKRWLNQHPDKDNPDAYLWFCRHRRSKHFDGDYISYYNLYYLVKDCAKRAGIKKRVTPHTFRHSIATIKASELTEQELKARFGWTGDSRMVAKYVHLSGEDSRRKEAQIRGIIPQKKNGEIIPPKKCPKCHSENPATFKYCGDCATKLELNPNDVCPRCGLINQSGSEFCTNCKLPLKLTSVARAQIQELMQTVYKAMEEKLVFRVKDDEITKVHKINGGH